MELIEEDFSSFTTKGRRTKRHRSILSISAADSCYPGGTGGGGGGGSNMSYISSSSSYEHDDHDDHDHDVLSEVTTEEDMANCLILLAQGIQKNTSSSYPVYPAHGNYDQTLQRDERQQSIPIKENATKESLCSNKKQSKMINNNPYECKTCGRTFSSFQALGGHRTSHKKIKLPPPDHRNEHRDAVVFYDREHDHNHDHDHTRIINKSRVHECSICGSEFPSGQALGGHMRRHRATTNHGRPISSSTTPDYDPTVVIDTSGPRNILSLDLNLPAPDDDQDYQQLQEESDNHMETTKFVHVLPLVDCYY